MTIFVVAVILALSIFFARRQAHKLAGATIQSAQGQIRLDEEHGEGGITYYVFVGKKKFAFSEDTSRVFREGEKYKVYYCKSGVYEMVLSYEKVES